MLLLLSGYTKKKEGNNNPLNLKHKKRNKIIEWLLKENKNEQFYKNNKKKTETETKATNKNIIKLLQRPQQNWWPVIYAFVWCFKFDIALYFSTMFWRFHICMAQCYQDYLDYYGRYKKKYQRKLKWKIKKKS